MRNKRTVLLVVLGLLVLSFLAGHVTAGGGPGRETAPRAVADSQEWDEVRKRYPRFAVEYLKGREALAEGVRFAKAVNPSAFNSSAFRTALEGLCDRTDRVRPLFCTLLDSGAAPPDRKRCPNCTKVCSAGVAPVDCADCLQKRGDAGCL